MADLACRNMADPCFISLLMPSVGDFLLLNTDVHLPHLNLFFLNFLQILLRNHTNNMHPFDSNNPLKHPLLLISSLPLPSKLHRLRHVRQLRQHSRLFFLNIPKNNDRSDGMPDLSIVIIYTSIFGHIIRSS